MGSRGGQWLSLKENNRSLDALMQSWLRTKANGFAAFKKVMAMRSNNSNNTVFADDQGHIAYWHGNFMPRRDPNFDYSLPVDGSISATDWKGVHELDEIVHVYDPASGWIENCNSTPFTVSGASSPDRKKYPVYMAPDGQNFRALNAMRLLDKTSNMDVDGLIRNIGYSHYLGAFDVLLPSLLEAYDGLSSGDSLKALLAEPVGLLRSWDKNSSEGSVATSVAVEWAYRMAAQAPPVDNPYKLSDAVGQINAMAHIAPRKQLELLLATLNDLRSRFGSWKTVWGSINRYQRVEGRAFDDGKASLPVGLAAGTWGSIPSFATIRTPQTNCRYGVSGNSFIACVEFGKKVKARTIITGGQSFDPASPHYTDQAQAYIGGQLKTIFFYKDDVLQHAVRQYHPGE